MSARCCGPTWCSASRWPGREGYHIEDVVVIREDGPELVTTFMDTSELMVV